MAQKVTALRIVLASPSDVKRERQAFARIIEQVNNDTARPAGFHLELWRWETDSRPGFNPMGPQGLIDQVLKNSHSAEEYWLSGTLSPRRASTGPTKAMPNS